MIKNSENFESLEKFIELADMNFSKAVSGLTGAKVSIAGALRECVILLAEQSDKDKIPDLAHLHSTLSDFKDILDLAFEVVEDYKDINNIKKASERCKKWKFT